MVESGAAPKVSFVRRQVTRIGRAMTTPLLPDDYFALIRPTWSTRESTGTVVRTIKHHGDAVTVVIRPDFRWTPHQPGQYLRIGMEINGIRHWRAYSLTSDPGHPGGLVSITVKNTEGGRMSPVFNFRVQPGQRVYLGDVEGEFTLPDPLPAKKLFISAGSGVTPVMSMLRELERRDALDDVERYEDLVDVRGATVQVLEVADCLSTGASEGAWMRTYTLVPIRPAGADESSFSPLPSSTDAWTSLAPARSVRPRRPLANRCRAPTGC